MTVTAGQDPQRDQDGDQEREAAGDAAGTDREAVVIDAVAVEVPAADTPDTPDTAATAPVAPVIQPDIFKASPDGPPDGAASPPPASSGVGSNASTLAIAALLLAGVAVAQPLWAPYLPGFAPKVETTAQPAVTVPMPELPPPAQPDPATAAALKTLSDKLAVMEKDMASRAALGFATLPPSDATVPPMPAPDPRVDALSAELAALKGQLAGLVEQQAAAARKPAAKADAGTPPVPLPGGLTPAVALAIGRLQSDITLGQPFAASLTMLRETAGRDAAIAAAADTLQPLAATGVATQPVLLARFSGLGSDIIRAAHRGEGADWLDKVGGTLATLVTVRRYGPDIEGTSVEAITGRAEAALNAGKLDQAVAELSGLSGPAAAVAGPWLGAAQARLTADLAAKTIADRAFALLAQADKSAENKSADKGGNAQ